MMKATRANSRVDLITLGVIKSIDNDGASGIDSMTKKYDEGRKWLRETIETIGDNHVVRSPALKKARVAKKENVKHDNFQISGTIGNFTKEIKSIEDQTTDKIMAMKVSELRRELKKMCLETGGLKKDLQNRLLSAIGNTQRGKPEVENEAPANDHHTSKAIPMEGVTLLSPQKNAGNHDEVVHDTTIESRKSMDIITGSELPSKSIVVEGARHEQSTTTSRNPPLTNVASFVRSAAKMFSPNRKPAPLTINVSSTKYANNASNSKSSNEIVKLASRMFSPTKKGKVEGQLQRMDRPVICQQKVEKAREEDAVKGGEPPHSSDTTHATLKKVAGSEVSKKVALFETKATASGKNEIQGMPKSREKLTTATENMKKQAEARKQRLAEMRCKSRPIQEASNSAREVKANHFSSQPTSSSKYASAQDRVIGLTAKMREKHASQTIPTGQKIPDYSHSVPPGPDTSSLTSHPNSAFDAEVGQQISGQSISSGSSSVEQAKKENVGAVASEASKRETQQVSQSTSTPSHRIQLTGDKKSSESIRSPMQTYDISEHEDSSDEDSEMEEEKRKHKKIPVWAQKPNLLKALKAQYHDRFDPDEIFCEVESCSLEAIFGKQKMRYRKRTSSGIWTKDRVTNTEKKSYKKAMGFV